MNKIQVIHAFWSGFGIKAYNENSVPTGLKYPYITYDMSWTDDFGEEVAQTASIWYKTESKSWTDVAAKAQEISAAIGGGGTVYHCDDGTIWIKKANPWAQLMGDAEDDSIRRIVLNVAITFFV